jgi:hypothetical protein
MKSNVEYYADMYLPGALAALVKTTVADSSNLNLQTDVLQAFMEAQ